MLKLGSPGTDSCELSGCLLNIVEESISLHGNGVGCGNDFLNSSHLSSLNILVELFSIVSECHAILDRSLDLGKVVFLKKSLDHSTEEKALLLMRGVSMVISLHLGSGRNFTKSNSEKVRGLNTSISPVITGNITLELAHILGDLDGVRLNVFLDHSFNSDWVSEHGSPCLNSVNVRLHALAGVDSCRSVSKESWDIIEKTSNIHVLDVSLNFDKVLLESLDSGEAGLHEVEVVSGDLRMDERGHEVFDGSGSKGEELDALDGHNFFKHLVFNNNNS